MDQKNLIRSITLNNFMCHKNIKIDFKEAITVIGGFNGSGKSAVMIGIGIALGLKTYALERGTSYKSLIRTGKSVAKIDLVLCNETAKYNYAFFGSEIIVERTLRQIGASTLKIKNESGKVFSTKKEDLDFILQNLQLHVDNPLNFQTQESSKKFLKNSKPEILYELFMKGTELNDVIDLHKEAQEKTSEMKTKVDAINQELSEIEQRRTVTERNLNIVLEGARYEEKIEDLRKELEWSKLNVFLEEIKAKSLEIGSYDIQIGEIRGDIAQNKQRAMDLEEEQAQKLLEIESVKNSFESKKRELFDLVSNLKNEEKELQDDFKDILTGLKEKDENLRNIRKIGGVDSLTQKKEELKVASEEVKKLRNELNNKNHELQKEEERVNFIQQEMNNLKQKESNLAKQIVYLKKLKQDQNSIFHKNMSAILEELKNTQFKKDVIGPIGNFLKLKNYQWQKAISTILKNVLSNFIVFDHDDKNKLRAIFKKHNAQFGIILPTRANNSLIDYYKVRGQLVALDVLDITHEKRNLIINHLIISSALERTLLIEKREDAYTTLMNESKKHHRYPVDVAYCLKGDRIEYKGGRISDSHVHMSQYFFEHSEKKLKKCIDDKDEVAAQIFQLRNTSKVPEIQMEIDKMNAKIKELSTKVEDLKIETSFEIGDDLGAQIKTIEEEIAEMTEQKEEMEVNLKKIQNSKIKAENEIKESCGNLPVLDFELKKKIEAIKMDNNILDRKLQVLADKRDKKAKEEFTLNHKYAHEERALNLRIPKISDPRPESEIIKEIRECEIKKDLAKQLKKQETLKSDLKELNSMYNDKKDILQQFETSISNTIANIKLRIAKREALKISTGEKIAKNFERLTGKRNYKGTLTFNHEQKTLDLKMKVNILAGDKNTLSGGERSFAAMCLILSIWPFIGCPVKILDEFDVFMDNLNRDTILKELFDMFQESGLQIILITPLSMKLSNVDYIALQHPSRTV